MGRSYSFFLELDLERNGTPFRGEVLVQYEVHDADASVGDNGGVEVVGVSRTGRPIRRLERFLLTHYADYLAEMALNDWIDRGG